MSSVSTEAADVLGPFTGPARLSSLTHNPKNGVTGGVWVVGAGDRSAVLKVLTRNKPATGRWAASDDPRHWNYWRREAEVYRSGLAQVWEPYGIRAPRLLACVERSDGDIALWLEHVRGTPGTSWPLARHIEHARRLGTAQGRVHTVDMVHTVDGLRLSADEPQPSAGHPWLSHRFLRQYVTSNTLGEDLLDNDDAWQQPLVRDHFPAGLRRDMVRLRHDREWFLQIMESLPRTLSHLDQWPANVRSDGPDHVLYDWAFTGDGALGEDLGNYLPDSVFDLFVPADRLPTYAAEAYEAYLHGLRHSGWKGDERLVRLGVCASAVKYDWLTAGSLARAGEEQLDYGGERTVPAELRYRERGSALAFLAGWAAEARSLAPQLGFPEAPSGR
ncbi:aminoglycoside phosphotransferase [Streptomyces sp. S.PB5]|uniref:aminoglycoside phosphotransferase n=1 Tax=Streptomyces sp. S.PB5 TaxID=3020844 RepID=UPI0025B230A0|nr:aminoglycoside phosphotransferase [Streptomyces sp. S.PB5]MDN3021727.1 aminoglycoside phosphotransferase [Streptomyces sp. S.PB5]